jgi:hypothetical protein
VDTCHAMGEHGWTHVMLWVGMGGHMSCYGWAWVAADGYGLGMDTNSKENVGLCLGVRIWPKTNSHRAVR